ncbi:pyrroloquinoline quinone-dependent dehydrogenase [Bradyrhizobium roseum]|uniref:pyrroloquinoline quinone-dependent dehydrogenase n=1 Tax=Bradyrhizobium roseum TaxID=3056648 RepID=UPI002604F8D7|nr:pyrroloquinoline quinone-dependent dehydrogenase [Bradyrhizobium roseus]WKA26775.1 pyrroloquinoline quinone-dependent dehydrogenase [Bradyrhizobium roseus]
MRNTVRLFVATFCIAISLPASAWEHWGGDRGGSRFSPLNQITPDNVGNLVRAWAFRTGDLDTRAPEVMKRTKFQATPLLVEDSLVFCSPFNEVIALDPGSGAPKWRYDPKISTAQRPANRYNCRGVAYWIDAQAAENAACRARIFMGTNDARVIALDAQSGMPCAGFGSNGEVKLALDPLDWPGEFQITSAPVVARDTVVVGSAIADNRRVDAPPGTVRAFDARTGQSRWSFDPLLHGGIVAGHANVWAPMSVDEERGLVFLPTSSPSPDFWGGQRPGNNDYANSVVALRAESGERVWSYQTVHHDVWDYDLPAQPTLARIDAGQGPRDVVIQPTKQGFVFVLDRDTGQPVWPVEERAVPQGGAEGEVLSPTQPFPTHVPPLLSQQISVDEMFGLIPFWERNACRAQVAAARNEGLYTPPSTQGTVVFPMTGGGVNWGGAAFDPVNQILYANVSRAIHIVKLLPRAAVPDGFNPPPGHDFGRQQGAPFAMTRAVAHSPLGLLCNKPPWGEMVALDLKAGRILWRSRVGTTEDRAPLGIALSFGTPLVNGVAITAGGLVFTGAMDAYLRAFDARSGRELWQGRLPVPGVANPMTYQWKGEQYVAIGAGGHSESGTTIGDSVVAFRLARPGEAPSLWSRTIDRPGGRFRAGATATAVVVLLMAVLVWRRRRNRKLRKQPHAQ